MADSARVARARYRKFVERVTVTGEVWGLKSSDGWANCQSGLQPSATAMPFWSDKTAAAVAARGEWSAYEPTLIPLDMFVARWLTNMAAEGALVGPDWQPDVLSGYEVGAAEVQRRILKILELA